MFTDHISNPWECWDAEEAAVFFFVFFSHLRKVAQRQENCSVLMEDGARAALPLDTPHNPSKVTTICAFAKIGL